MFGFELEVWINYLDLEYAKPLLKEEAYNKYVSDGTWVAKPLDEATVKAEMAEYMRTYGWDKALSHRGISASRTIEKMLAWILGDVEGAELVNAAPYENYGCPKLKVICERYGFEIPDHPALKNMSEGKECEPHCCAGCGG